MGHSSEVVFVNSPVQNGEFTFADRPGKAVGIRIAAALSTISGIRPAPHLWNTVTLAGDLRYRAYATPERRPRSRLDFENMVIAAKYPSGAAPPPAVLTDADEQVATLALEIIEARLSTGALQIRTLTVRVCAGCAHMTGASDRPCRACGHPDTCPVRARHLVADRDPDAAILVDGDFAAHGRRKPAHLCQIAGNVPPTLIMSRTRDHGIDLAPIGLDGLVLDPRAGIHVTVMAVARARQATRVVMTTTANAAANVAAYGRLFFRHDGRRLLYALHGHIPYDHITDLRPVYAARGINTAYRAMFEAWFLPLAALKEKNGIPAGQLPALLKHFHRSRLARPSTLAEADLADLRGRIHAGDTDWVMDKKALAAAMTVADRHPHTP